MLVIYDGNIRYASLWIVTTCFLTLSSGIILVIFYEGVDGLCWITLSLELELFLLDISKMKIMNLCKAKNYEICWYYDIRFP